MGKLASHSACGTFGRRSLMRGAACAVLCAAAAPELNLLAGSAIAASNWRGLAGCVKPTATNSSLVAMIRLLPRGLGAALRHHQHRGRAALHDPGPGGRSDARRWLEAKIPDRHVHFVAKPGQRAQGDEDQEHPWHHAVRTRSQQELREIFRGLRYR